VPVLYNPAITPPFNIGDSLEILFWLCDRYPSLSPPEYAADISRLLKNFYKLNFFTLSFGTRQNIMLHTFDGINKLLAKPDLSPRYKKALEYKANR
jgi:hypothetical protein